MIKALIATFATRKRNERALPMPKTSYQEEAMRYADAYLNRLLCMEDVANRAVELRLKQIIEQRMKQNTDGNDKLQQ